MIYHGPGRVSGEPRGGGVSLVTAAVADCGSANDATPISDAFVTITVDTQLPLIMDSCNVGRPTNSADYSLSDC